MPHAIAIGRSAPGVPHRDEAGRLLEGPVVKHKLKSRRDHAHIAGSRDTLSACRSFEQPSFLLSCCEMHVRRSRWCAPPDPVEHVVGMKPPSSHAEPL
jgi:hypothetical protein